MNDVQSREISIALWKSYWKIHGPHSFHGLLVIKETLVKVAVQAKQAFC